MSSIYRAICLSHDPAIELNVEWQSSKNGRSLCINTVVERNVEILGSHNGCDLVVGRYSYPIVEIGCPLGSIHSLRFGHTEPKWIESFWLRLLWDVHNRYPEGHSLFRQIPSCWAKHRLSRLIPLLRE